MVLRFLVGIILLFSALFMPFWVSFILVLLGLAYFPIFFEAVLIFLISDLLYAVPQARFLNFVFISSTSIFICLIVLEFIQDK